MTSRPVEIPSIALVVDEAQRPCTLKVLQYLSGEESLANLLPEIIRIWRKVIKSLSMTGGPVSSVMPKVRP
eukprot:10520721-Heterocapsa_arctica.AAC.1